MSNYHEIATYLHQATFTCQHYNTNFNQQLYCTCQETSFNSH